MISNKFRVFKSSDLFQLGYGYEKHINFDCADIGCWVINNNLDKCDEKVKLIRCFEIGNSYIWHFYRIKNYSTGNNMFGIKTGIAVTKKSDKFNTYKELEKYLVENNLL